MQFYLLALEKTFLMCLRDCPLQVKKRKLTLTLQCAGLLACIGEDALDVFEGLPFARKNEET